MNREFQNSLPFPRKIEILIVIDQKCRTKWRKEVYSAGCPPISISCCRFALHSSKIRSDANAPISCKSVLAIERGFFPMMNTCPFNQFFRYLIMKRPNEIFYPFELRDFCFLTIGDGRQVQSLGGLCERDDFTWWRKRFFKWNDGFMFQPSRYLIVASIWTMVNLISLYYRFSRLSSPSECTEISS